MIEGRIIVCVASSWDYDPTSKHHLMKVLSRYNDVVWINYRGTRRPKLTNGDFRASVSALTEVMRGIRRVSPSMIQMTPMVIPGVAHPVPRSVHEWMLVAQIRRAIRAIDASCARRVQVWAFAPDVAFLIGRFNEECFLYYCVDEHSQFDGIDSARIAAVEAELVRRSDVVVASSGPLFDAKRRMRADTVLLRHGVDYDHFAAALREDLPCPLDIADVPRPIFGFFGAIHTWVDLELIGAVASMRPGYSFVLIGEHLVDISPLSGLPNVVPLGRRPNAELPSYCAAFCAGLIPFKQTAMTRHVNPIKMNEYLAAGLPVVSTSLPEARRCGGHVTTADSPEAFAAACDAALHSDNPERREAISSVVRSESWQSKVERLSSIIEQRVLSNERSYCAGEPSRRSCAGVL
ncbi:MAG: glycosyltransferase [Phycisphaerae bacterium]